MVPITWNSCPSTMMVFPIGSTFAYSPFSRSWPITATGNRRRLSSSVKKRPRCRSTCPPRAYASSTPMRFTSYISLPVVDIDRPVVGKQHGRHIFYRLRPLPDLDGVLISEILTRPLLGSEPAGPRPHRKLENDNRIRPETAQHPGH